MSEDQAVRYKEIYRIIPLPKPLDSEVRYSVRCVIERYEGGHLIQRRAYDKDPLPQGFRPHDLAIEESTQLGKDIIDGKHPDHTPP